MRNSAIQPGRPPRVGEKAPRLELINGKGPDGKAAWFRLSEACRKGPVVVAFFPGAFTATCTKELCRFTEDWSRYDSLGVGFIGVSVDSWRVLEAYARAHDIRVPLGSDFERVAVREWGLVWDSWWGPCARRATFVVDRSGTIRFAEVQADADPEPDYAGIQATLQGLR